MFVIGLKILFTGRWKGAARVWPTVAESWAVVTVLTFVIFGEPLSNWIGGGHLLLGYATLGVILALRPELTGPGTEQDSVDVAPGAATSRPRAGVDRHPMSAAVRRPGCR
ncbi:hypothetical protein FXF52_36525 [Micromonospora sp. MP36]|nr:hypothetical protein FXF52_36525 [Micromonospora sp. MP36]